MVGQPLAWAGWLDGRPIAMVSNVYVYVYCLCLSACVSVPESACLIVCVCGGMVRSGGGPAGAVGCRPESDPGLHAPSPPPPPHGARAGNIDQRAVNQTAWPGRGNCSDSGSSLTGTDTSEHSGQSGSLSQSHQPVQQPSSPIPSRRRTSA